MPVPRLTPPVDVDPEKTISVLAPMLAMLFCNMALEPWPISVMAMTAATAIMTPSAESPDRILFRRIADSAVRQVAGNRNGAMRRRGAAASFFPSAATWSDGCTSAALVSVTSCHSNFWAGSVHRLQ